MNANVASSATTEFHIVSVPSDHYFVSKDGDAPSVSGVFEHIPLSEPAAGGTEPCEALSKEPILPESETMTPAEMQLLTELNNSISALARQVGVSLNE